MAESLVASEPGPAPPAPPVAPTASPAPPSPVPAAPPDWRASLPPDLQAHKGLEKFKSPGDLAKSYVELETYRGRSLAIPGPDATPEDQVAFWTKVGAHDAPDKYVVPVPEGETLDETMLRPFQEAAFQAHMTQAQWAAMVSRFREVMDPGPRIERMKVDSVTALQAKYGGGYKHVLQTAAAGLRHVEHMAGTSGRIHEKLIQTGLSVDPDFVELFRALGRDYSEHGDIPKDAQSGTVIGPEMAKQKIATIYADKTHPFHRAGPGHAEAVQEMYQLNELLAAASPE